MLKPIICLAYATKKRKEKIMKKTYEKPVIKILKLDNSMQIICSSGVTNQTNYKVNPWEKTDEINANGTSDSLKVLPEWFNKL